jgi:hypothetical protein
MDAKRKSITFRVSSELGAKIKAEAKKDRRTVSNYLSWTLSQLIQNGATK